ncbi:MAG: hypothetical protein IJ013_01210 [Bacteroidaceae bacterium]|nr:hypothetical protein [Bacteroidaceae bacterium]
MKPAKNNLPKLFMGGLCLVVGLLCLLPTPASAQLTVKERAMRNRNRPALWFLSKNKEKYMHYQPDTTKQEKPVKEKAPADYNIYRGNVNLLLFGNTYTRHWTYVPQADTHAETGGATFFTGLGVGFEYAYRDNRMVSLGWSVSGSVDAIGCGGSTGESSVVHQIDLLHSWNIKRLTLSAGPTVAWKRWSHWVDEHDPYVYSPEEGFDYIPEPAPEIPAPWDEDFTFRHWSAGLKVKAHFRFITNFSMGVEYGVRRAWEKPFRHNFDHQLTVKGQIRFRVFGKKSGSGK